MSADEAAALIGFGTRIGMSGFTGAGYAKAVPLALARIISDAKIGRASCRERVSKQV